MEDWHKCLQKEANKKKEAKVKAWHYPSYLLAQEYSTFDKKELSKFKKMTNYMSDWQLIVLGGSYGNMNVTHTSYWPCLLPVLYSGF